MNKKISILLPSLREKLVNQRIIEWANTNFDIDYEIILVSPFQVINGKVTWIRDNPPFRGSVHATNQAVRIAQGEYVLYMSDDVKPTKGCLRNMIDFIKEQTIHPFLGAFKMINSNGKEVGPFGSYNKLYACYGCISKEDLMRINKGFGGNLRSDSSLDFALDKQNDKKLGPKIIRRDFNDTRYRKVSQHRSCLCRACDGSRYFL